jgi:2-keto-4-pentenoate hydratase
VNLGTRSGPVVDLADRLWRAEVDGKPIEPLTDTCPELTVADAYAVQAVNVDRRIAAGGVLRGRTLGMTSRASRQLLGTDEPVHGALLDDMFVADGGVVGPAYLLQPRVAGVIAFVLAGPLAGPGVTTADVLTAAAGVLPAIEIADCRIADWRIGLADTVADNACAGRVVLGGRLTPVTAVDLPLVGAMCHRNGVPVESGAGAAALDNPANGVAWLANRLGAQGSSLAAGDVVLSGALHRLVPARNADVFHVGFAHLGGVTVRFGGMP